MVVAFGMRAKNRVLISGSFTALLVTPPPQPYPKGGSPLPLERQGGGGPGQLTRWGYPLQIPFLGDELNGVSDVNPCRKTGGGTPFGYP